jgi:hypothetical protein
MKSELQLADSLAQISRTKKDKQVRKKTLTMSDTDAEFNIFYLPSAGEGCS